MHLIQYWPLAARPWLTASILLAEVFHPWERWAGPRSGFESSSGTRAGSAQGLERMFQNTDILQVVETWEGHFAKTVFMCNQRPLPSNTRYAFGLGSSFSAINNYVDFPKT